MAKAIQHLLEKYRDKNFTETDWKQLENLLNNDQQKEEVIAALQEAFDNVQEDEGFDEARFIPLLKNILDADKSLPKARVRSVSNIKWLVVAASVVSIILTLTYLLLINKNHVNDFAENVTPNLEAPVYTKAFVTLADGKTIGVNSVANGTIATQNNVDIFKTADGQIVYNPVFKNNGNIILFNTLTNPRGSTVVTITLNDGTKVWLNAGSSITYPVAFLENERNVFITGEAYFEVAKSKRPFLVQARNMQTKVLGTHFNVTAYENDQVVKTTLVEGSVEIISGGNKIILSPGQQAQVLNTIKVFNSANVDEVMAWKNGMFHFNSSDLQTIMRQIGEWYDVDIVYEGSMSKETFSGIVTRNENISELLKILEEAGFKFRIEGKKLIVMSFK